MENRCRRINGLNRMVDNKNNVSKHLPELALGTVSLQPPFIKPVPWITAWSDLI